jgi:hypothetical protein
MITFILGLVIGFILGASKFKSKIVIKIKEIFNKTKNEINDSFKD